MGAVENFPMPPEFFKCLTYEDFMEIVHNDSCLTPRLRDLYYRLMDIQNPPPDIRIKLYFNRADVGRLVRELREKRDKGSP